MVGPHVGQIPYPITDPSFTVPKVKSCLDKMAFHYMGGVQYEAIYLRERLDVDWRT